MNFPYSILFFDLDGTLLKNDHETISPRTVEVLKALHDRGVRLSIATGRARCILPQGIQALVPFDYCISSNGADVYEFKTKAHLATSYMDAFCARAAYDILKDRGVAIEWYVHNEIMLLEKDAEHILSVNMAAWHTQYFARGEYPVYRNAEDFFAAGAPGLEKINPLLRAHQDVRAQLWRALDETHLFSLSGSLGHNLEINALGCTKGRAIRALCERVGLDINETLAFGDGNNDAEMLKSCNTGVAVGNAMETLKACADHVTDTNENDGVAVFLEKYL